MTLPASGVITMGDVNTELGLSPTVSIGLNDTIVRNLFVKPTGAISLDDGHGKSSLLPIEDVFSAYTYTANGTARSIVNGIDLAGNGGMVWSKGRTNSESHTLIDTARGANKYISSHNATAQTTGYTDLLTSFNSNGYSLGADASTIGLINNGTSINFVSWTFRKAKKFFDVVTWTGNGANNRTIGHSLDMAPGMILVRCLEGGDWWCYHRATSETPNSDYFNLNSPNPVTISGGNIWNPTSTGFYVQDFMTTNTAGATYVAYLFAHDTGADGLIQCGSYIPGGTGHSTVTLGWEPQYLLTKSASLNGNWEIFDSSRGWIVTTGSGSTINDKLVWANLNNAETTANRDNPTATGFVAVGSASETYLYMAIRRGPMKRPTVGTQVYNAATRTGTGAVTNSTGAGFPPDLTIIRNTNWFQTVNRLTGPGRFHRMQSAVGVQNHEPFDTLTNFTMTGASFGEDAWYSSFNVSAEAYTDHYFRRYPGVFDFIVYTGTYSATTKPHNLKVIPEMMIVREVESNCEWGVYHKDLGNTYRTFLNHAIAAATDVAVWNSTTPTSSVVSLGASDLSNGTAGYAAYHIMYLFATLAGISKVGSYTGNGSSQTIDCGFTTGARFILIKQSAANTPWIHWNTVQGITAGDDPYSNMNAMGAPVGGTDSIDPGATGFIVNQVAATNINVTSATYIYLAFA